MQDRSDSEWDESSTNGCNTPLNSFHSAFLSKPSTSIGKSTAKHRDAVVYSTGIPMENFLRDECPPVDLLCRHRSNGPTAFVGYVDVVG